MKERITVDLKDSYEEDNKKFFNLLNPDLWDMLIEKYTNPGNNKSINELLTELLER